MDLVVKICIETQEPISRKEVKMTIQEAINSDKPFTHADIDYYICIFQNFFFIHSYKYLTYSMNVRLNPEKVTVTPDGGIRGSRLDFPKQVVITVSGIQRTDWEIKNEGEPQ